MAYENIQIAFGGDEASGVAEVSICRPDKLNALNDATIAELADAFTNLPEGARAAILTGAGEAVRIESDNNRPHDRGRSDCRRRG